MKRRKTVQKLIVITIIVIAFLIIFFAYALQDQPAQVAPGVDFFPNQTTQNQEQVRAVETRFMLDTYATIAIYHDIYNSEITQLFEDVFYLITELENLMSKTIKNSDIHRINHSSGEPTAVDFRTIEVILSAMEFGEMSNGLFDITVGRLSYLWDFDEVIVIPEQAELLDALDTVNFRQISILGNTVTLEGAKTWIDLGGIAKGFIADQVANFLIENGVTSAMIDLGGDIRLIGAGGGENPWRIAIRDPFAGGENFAAIIEVSDAAVVSSGTYERRFEIDGITYHHILDPRTGFPSQSDVVSATVIAQSGIVGEGLSTIAILVGSKAFTEILESHPEFIGAIIILNSGEIIEIGNVRIVG